jgi:hypothetical protein
MEQRRFCIIPQRRAKLHTGAYRATVRRNAEQHADRQYHQSRTIFVGQQQQARYCKRRARTQEALTLLLMIRRTRMREIDMAAF